MKYVLDSSVAFKWAIVEQDTPKARQLRDDFLTGIHELIAPDLFPAEIAHAITRAERLKRITPAEGAQFLKDLFNILPQLYPYLPLLPRAYDLSSSIRIGIYDCLYVALAEREGCGLVTADSKLLSNFQFSFPFIIPLSAVP